MDGSMLPTPPSSRSATSARSRRGAASSSDESIKGPFGISSVRYRVGAPPLRPLPLAPARSHLFKSLCDAFEEDFVAYARKILLEYNISPEEDVVYLEDAHWGGGPEDVYFGARQEPNDETTAAPTLFISSRWTEDAPDTWPKIVALIKRYIDAAINLADDVSHRHFDVYVEMVARELTMDKYMANIPDSENNFAQLKSDWEQIREKVLEILESFEQSAHHVTAVALFKLGFSPDPTQNPNTVYISLDFESNELAWPPIVKAVQAYLDQYPGHALQAHIEHNVVFQYAFQLLSPSTVDPTEINTRLKRFNFPRDYSKYDTKVAPGVDIGAATYITRKDGQLVNPLVGSMGCYLQYQTRNDPNWKTVALTNYHVIRPAIPGFQLASENKKSVMAAPADGSPLLKADQRGTFPRKTQNCTPMEHPTRPRHNANISVLRLAVAKCGPDRSIALDRELETKTAFFDDGRHLFANVLAGSGYLRRSCTDGRLDWALLEPNPIRIPAPHPNPLPSWEEFRRSGYSDDFLVESGGPERFPQILRNPPDAPEEGLRSLRQNTCVFKIGSITATSIGYFNELKPTCVIREEAHLKLSAAPDPEKGRPKRMSTEYTFMGHLQHDENRPFADQGDSGAVVFDIHGRVLGLVFSGFRPQRGDGAYVLVTPIEDVLEDIKDLSKGEITAIRVAEP